MSVRVVDASALGALVFGEPKAEEIARTLEDSPMVAPALIWFELASICLPKIKTHPPPGNGAGPTQLGEGDRELF